MLRIIFSANRNLKMDRTFSPETSHTGMLRQGSGGGLPPSGESLPITAGGMYYRAHKEKLNEESKERYRRRAKRTKLEAAKREILRLQEELRAALAAVEAQLVEVQPRPRCGPRRAQKEGHFDIPDELVSITQ